MVDEADEFFRCDVGRCARCGGDHPDMMVANFARPPAGLTHWTVCPRRGEPILMQFSASERARLVEREMRRREREQAEKPSIPVTFVELSGAGNAHLVAPRDVPAPILRIITSALIFAERERQRRAAAQPPEAPPKNGYLS